MLRYSLRQLEHFLAVAESGGIAQAARRLGISPAAVAASISRLEEVLNLILFERHQARGLVLTSAGLEFMVPAKSVVRDAGNLQQTAQALSDGKTGRLRFGCYHSLSYMFAPLIVQEHRLTRPGVVLDVVEDTYQDLVIFLEAGEVDAVLAYDQGFDPLHFTIRHVARVSPKVILPLTHPLATRPCLNVEDLRNLPYLKVQEYGPGPSYLDMLRVKGLDPEIALVSRSYEMVRSCVGKGMGYTLAAFQPPNPNTYHGDAVIAVPLIEPLGFLDIVIARRKSADFYAINPTLEHFTELCASVVSKGVQ